MKTKTEEKIKLSEETLKVVLPLVQKIDGLDETIIMLAERKGIHGKEMRQAIFKEVNAPKDCKIMFDKETGEVTIIK